MIKSFNLRYSEKKQLLEMKNRCASVPSENMLIQIFSGVLDQNVIRRLLSELMEVFPRVSVVGASTAGEIMDGESLEQTIVINFCLFEQTRVNSVLIPQNENLNAAGQQIGRAFAEDRPKAVIVFGCGLKGGRTINGEPLLSAIQSELPDTIIAGGQAGDNGIGEITFVFTEAGISETGFAAASLSGRKLQVNNTYNLSWVPIGKMLTITKAEGPVVYGIDNQSPYDIYCHYLGQDVADNLPLSAADFPLIIERDGIQMAIHATGVNDDGSFHYIHDFHAGEQLRFGFCHAGLLALSAEKTCKEVISHEPQAIFLYSCVSRKWVLGADISVELSSVAGHAPSAGFYAYGEYFHHRQKGKTYFFSQTMTVLSLSEPEERPGPGTVRGKKTISVQEESKHFKTLRVLHRLVDTSSREIETMSKELAKLAHRDSLTGLANRRHFDEFLHGEMKRLNRSLDLLSLIILDVDFFKNYNDTYGHVAGDDCLRGVAQVLRETINRPSDIASRYGGEEFACVLPMTTQKGAVEIAERIRSGVEKLKIPHSQSRVAEHLTISLGVLTVNSESSISAKELVTACDTLLYQAKKQGRNRVIGKDLSITGQTE